TANDAIINGPQSGNNDIDVASEARAFVASGPNSTVEISPSTQFADGGPGTNTLIVPGSVGGGSAGTLDVALGAAADIKSNVVQSVTGARLADGSAGAQFFSNFILASTGTSDVSVYAEGLNQLSHTIVTGIGNDTLVGGYGNNFLDAGTGDNTLIAAATAGT